MDLFEKLLLILYPTACGFCGKIQDEVICKGCLERIKHCKRARPNLRTKKETIYYDEIVSIYCNEGYIKDKLLQLQKEDKAYLARSFAKILLNNKKGCGFLENYDIIIPIPIAVLRAKKRGYDQNKLIANFLTKQLKNKIIYQDILRIKKDNVYNIVNKEIIKDKKIVLLQDIYRQDKKINEYSRLLKQLGAKQIGIITIAKD